MRASDPDNKIITISYSFIIIKILKNFLQKESFMILFIDDILFAKKILVFGSPKLIILQLYKVIPVQLIFIFFNFDF